MDSLNLVAVTGVLERDPLMRFGATSSSAQCAATLRCEEVNANGSTFTLYVPLEAFGRQAEALGELHAGALVAVQGKLCWRKYTTRQGEEKSSLAVLVQRLHVLTPALQEVPAGPGHQATRARSHEHKRQGGAIDDRTSA